MIRSPPPSRPATLHARVASHRPHLGWLLLACTWMSCLRQEELWITGNNEPLPPATRAIVLGASRTAGNLELYALEAPFALSVARDPELRLVAWAFDRDLRALDLTPGRLSAIPGTGGRLAPPALATYAAEPRRLFAPAVGELPLVLPPHDWPAILSAGRCGEGRHYIGSACGSTVSFAVSPPQPPVLPDEGQCPPGWTRKPYALAKVDIEVCEPPPRLRCEAGTQQAAGDDRCRMIGEPCPTAGAFPPGRSTTSTTVFVLAGAAAPADGSLEHPYPTLREGAAEAQRRGARALVLGRGTYAEGLSLSGRVDAVGACAAETVIQGTLSLVRHQGQVSNVSVAALATAPLAVERGSESALVGVRITVSSSISDNSHVFDSALEVRGSALLLPDAGTWGLHAARLSLTDSTYRGQIHADSSELAVTGSAILGTGGPIVAANSTVSVDQSYLAIPLHHLGGRLEVRRSWLVGASVVGEAVQRSVFVSGGAALLSKLTIDHRRVGDGSTPPGTWLGVEVHATPSPAQLSDLLILLPTQAVNAPLPDTIGVGFFEASVAPHQVQRAVIQGATHAGVRLSGADVVLTDVGIHRSLGYGVLGFNGGVLEAKRLEITESLLDSLLMKRGRATLQDVGIYEPRKAGLVVQGEGPFIGARLRVASEQATGIGVRAEEAPEIVSLVVQELDIRGPFGIGLQVGTATGLRLRHFRIEGAALGADLVGVSEHRSLSQGTIRAERAGLNVATDLGELAPLLDGVSVTAPRPLERHDD